MLFKYYKDLICISIITVLSLTLTYNIKNIIDIGLSDETAYLWYGVNFFNMDWTKGIMLYSPIYMLWYRFLYVFENDKVNLYYLNYQILNFLPIICFYIFIRSQKVCRTVGLLASVIMLASYANFYTWPKISQFCLCIIFMGLTFASLFKSTDTFYMVLSLFMLIASYARPEMFIAFIIFAFVFLCLVFKNQKKPNKNKIFIWGATVCMVLYLLKTPYVTGRLFMAFKQHFYFNNPQDYFGYFGGSNSVIQCFLFDPILFVKNMYINFIYLFSSMPDLYMKPFFINEKYKLVYGLFYFIFSVILLLKIFNSKIRVTYFVNHAALSALLISMIPLLFIIMICPRQHYVIMFMAALLSAFLSSFEYANYSKVKLILIYVMIIFYLCFNLYINTTIANKPQPIVSSIQFLKTLKPINKILLFEPEGGFSCYLPSGWVARHNFSNKKKDYINLWACLLNESGINAIIINPEIEKILKRGFGDRDKNFFLENYAIFNFRKINIPKTNWYILVKKNISFED